jgi:uncharacterized protein
MGGFDFGIVNETAHRPWPMPRAPWVMTQTWNDLLFAHWTTDAALIRSHIPSDFTLDLFDGRAWLGVVPFYMTNVSPRGMPSLPWISEFAELNVRTYVRVGDRPGIYFFSLDAGSTLAVHAARALLNLPYYSAAMRVIEHGDVVEYESSRDGLRLADDFEATYEPDGPEFAARPGSIEYFLTERYCLYHHERDGEPYRLDIHHPPWRLQPARARITHDNMAEVNGLTRLHEPPLLHFVKRQDMIAWMPSSLRVQTS